MKALVLSGGRGTRLRPITYTGAKQLVPIANRPILFYILDNIAQAGIKEVAIIISPETGAEIEETVGDGARWGVSITYILQAEPKGLAHAVITAEEFLGKSPFVMYLGDNLIGSGIKDFTDAFMDGGNGREDRAEAAILLKPVENPSSFGIAEVAPDGEILGLVEKPAKPKSNLALVGVYLFSAAIHKAISGIKPSTRGELEITDAIQELINSGAKVKSKILETWWLDTGKKDDLLAANTIVLDEWFGRDIKGTVDEDSTITGRVTISPGAVVKNSTLRGPVVIGPDTIVEESFIGPFTSIGGGSKIIKSIIEHSVIFAGAVVDHVDRLEDSLIGRDAKVVRCRDKHKALRLMVGDDSVVEV
ncbi:MAG: glucose-1-phosphate thymidylyltransferase [Thermodesulfobacteriota bacterium]